MNIKHLTNFSPTQAFSLEMQKNILISLLGILLTLFTSFFLMTRGWDYLFAYAAGACTSLVASFVLRRIFLSEFLLMLQIKYSRLLFAHFLLSLFNILLVAFCVSYLRWSYGLSIVGVTSLTAVLNFIAVGLWSFVSLPPEEVFYEAVDGQFYDDMQNPARVGRFRAWMHSSRFARTRKCVETYYQPGMNIIDFACGSCSWNKNGLPVTGLDVNQPLMEAGVKQGRLKDFYVGDMYKSPFPSDSADIVISSQVFEHLHQPQKALEEIWRILKPGGTFIIDVPYDLFFGPHFLLFSVHCFFQGYIKGSDYYRKRCGHINHFTRRTMRQLLRGRGFKVEQIELCKLLTMHAVARKTK